MTDIVQILLSLPGQWGYVVCVALFAVLWLVWRYFWAVLGWVRKVFNVLRKPFLRFSWRTIPKLLFGGLVLFMLRYPAIVGLEYVENRYLHPAYYTSDTSSYVTDIYEAEMGKFIFPSQVTIVRNRTYEMASKLGSTPLCIYQVASAECGLNPFAFNIDKRTGDTLAAGWIQFTRAGIAGFGVSFRQVKDACINHDINFIMDLTEKYLTFWAKGRPLARPCDVYTSVFAPAHIGKPQEHVLYSTADGAYYSLNQGLDGYYVKMVNSQPLIMRDVWHKDGKITIMDLSLCLAMKHSKLISSYRKKN